MHSCDMRSHPGHLQGRGLGRMFLRHLRRTRFILHVVDAATGVLLVCLNKSASLCLSFIVQVCLHFFFAMLPSSHMC